ncbi:PfkB family carbohydrate kinase [Aureimonas pseudogalii]|uniref:Sugar/nucleoside kinase (Ribokinase family) n=1 Tax=Aureimonas pseudogalii TaxID=1744844 RepID=A0A7W6EGK0_9HYPH|nr:PfkB family carbohydrate kinase [Aureimonas pseudogalii]MBB3998370.1 sugar/nucleoside kinase (ribokinase family) [Aureimonas pseudogalii]
MIVVGGTYREICDSERWDRVFGSGGRAACAASRWREGVRLVSYAHETWIEDARATFSSMGVDCDLTAIQDEVAFVYAHSMATPVLLDGMPSACRGLVVDGDEVVRFGMLECEARVRARRAVHDPQGVGATVPFAANGSAADSLALVLNEGEARNLSGKESPDEAAAALLAVADAVVVKGGTAGALVARRGGTPVRVPPYRSERVMKIGSGDVFTGVFSHLWMREGADPVEAADLASRAVSVYVETRGIPPGNRRELSLRVSLPKDRRPGRIYVAAPFFTTAQLWLVEQLVRAIGTLGATPFSPFHEVGMGGMSSSIATEDLAGLESCDAVLAVMDGRDPGTLFEVGHARANGIPVVMLAENVMEGDLTMFAGTGCEVVGDVATAAYKAVWASYLAPFPGGAA